MHLDRIAFSVQPNSRRLVVIGIIPSVFWIYSSFFIREEDIPQLGILIEKLINKGGWPLWSPLCSTWGSPTPRRRDLDVLLLNCLKFLQ